MASKPKLVDKTETILNLDISKGEISLCRGDLNDDYYILSIDGCENVVYDEDINYLFDVLSLYKDIYQP